MSCSVNQIGTSMATVTPVVVAQAARFRSRLGFWETCVQAYE
jgi:hypothetical protein